jgi:hypothetical protein
MARIIDFAAPVTQKAGINHWNDLDLLEVSIIKVSSRNIDIMNLQVGNGGMSKEEYSTCFSLHTHWSMSKSLVDFSYAFLYVGAAEEPTHHGARCAESGTLLELDNP